MWKYSCGACYIIYDPLVLPTRWPRVNNIRACVCFAICYFRGEGKTRIRKKKGNFLSYVVFSRPHPYQSYRVPCAITLCIKNKNRRARKETVRHQFRGLTVSLFFHAIKSPSPPPPPPRSALLLLLPSCAGGMSGWAGKKKFRNRKRKIIIIRRVLV